MTTADSLTAERLDTLLDAVLGQVQSTDPRLNELMGSLIRHAHAFVRETRPTETEWMLAIDFSSARVRRARRSATNSSCCRTCSA